MNYSTAAKRKKLKQYYQALDAADAEWEERGFTNPQSELPGYPEECYGMMCGAKNRRGTPCKNKTILENGRCKFHGGLSTGPKTPEGKRKSALNGLCPKKAKSMDRQDSDKVSSKRIRVQTDVILERMRKNNELMDEILEAANRLQAVLERQPPTR